MIQSTRNESATGFASDNFYADGLTKRETAAISITNGLLSTAAARQGTTAELVERARIITDALFTELENNNGNR